MNKPIKRVWAAVILMIPALVQAQVSNPVADSSYAAFNSAFLIQQGGLTFYKTALNNSEKDYFWMQALDIQTPQDVYMRTNDASVKSTISSLLYAFLVQNTDRNSTNINLGAISIFHNKTQGTGCFVDKIFEVEFEKEIGRASCRERV